MYELRGEGPDGEVKYFVKPWTMVTVMFLGMSLSLPLAYMEQWAEEKKAKAEGGTPLLEKVFLHNPPRALVALFTWLGADSRVVPLSTH